jgi:hypothetical protein
MDNAVIDANLNNTQCLVTRTHFGYDTVINICSGKVQDIPWGMGNWLEFGAIIFITLLLAGIAIGFIAFVVAIMRDSM